ATTADQKLSELTKHESNRTNDNQTLNSIKEEAEQLQDHLLDIANTNVNGKYIFNGTNTETAPVTKNEDGDILIEHNISPVMIEVAHGTKLQVNVEGESIFSEDLFAD